jgi:hypothetical protein
MDQRGNESLMRAATCSAPSNSPKIRRTSETSEVTALVKAEASRCGIRSIGAMSEDFHPALLRMR